MVVFYIVDWRISLYPPTFQYEANGNFRVAIILWSFEVCNVFLVLPQNLFSYYGFNVFLVRDVAREFYDLEAISILKL